MCHLVLKEFDFTINIKPGVHLQICLTTIAEHVHSKMLSPTARQELIFVNTSKNRWQELHRKICYELAFLSQNNEPVMRGLRLLQLLTVLNEHLSVVDEQGNYSVSDPSPLQAKLNYLEQKIKTLRVNASIDLLKDLRTSLDLPAPLPDEKPITEKDLPTFEEELYTSAGFGKVMWVIYDLLTDQPRENQALRALPHRLNKAIANHNPQQLHFALSQLLRKGDNIDRFVANLRSPKLNRVGDGLSLRLNYGLSKASFNARQWLSKQEKPLLRPTTTVTSALAVTQTEPEAAIVTSSPLRVEAVGHPFFAEKVVLSRPLPNTVEAKRAGPRF